MANLDSPHGLIPLYRRGGGPIVSNEYLKDLNGGTAIFIGDVVQREADQNIAPGGTPGSTLWLGVACNYGAASTQTNHQVVDDPDVVFEVQEDGDSAVWAEADNGLNCNFIFGTGSSATFVSGHELDVSSKAVTATLDAKGLRRHGSLNNDYGLANVKLEIIFNKHLLIPNTLGI
jgi:hypothetical protein